MTKTRRKFSSFMRFFGLALVLLLPALTLGGSFAPSALAGAKPQSVPSQSPREEVLVLHIYFRDQAERTQIANELGAELGAEELGVAEDYLTLWASRSTYERLLIRYPNVRIEIDEAGTKHATEVLDTWHDDDPNTFYGGYRTVVEMVAFLDQKVAAYPNLAEKVDVGDSWCKAHPGMCVPSYAGNDLWALRITNRSIPGPKPVYWFDAGIHSREIATPEVAMRFINLLLDGYNTNADSRWLVDWHDIWVMPMQNPDGHYIVEQGGNNPFTQRKNLDNDDGCIVYPPTNVAQTGVDVNRNYPFQWGCCGGSSGVPCDLTYRGPSAGSENETQAVLAKIRALIPDQRGPGMNDAAPITTTGVIQTMHSFANLNLYAWGHTGTPSPNNADLQNIGAHMSALNAYGNNFNSAGNGYRYGQPPNLLYGVDGDQVSWGYGELGAASYTTELSGGTFFPAYTCIDNPGCGSARGLWPENRGMLVYLAKIARTPYLTTRGPDANMVATNPMTVTQGTPADLAATVNYNWTGNAYLQNVAAAEYYIDTPPWAGGTPAAMTASDGSFNSPTEGVQATIATNSLTVGRHVVFVRGRGVNNYEGHQSWGPVTAVFLDVAPQGSTPVATNTSAPSNTPTRTSTPRVTPTPLGCGASILAFEGFENNSLGVFTSTTTTGTHPWQVVTTTVNTGVYAAHVDDPNEPADQQLTQRNPVVIPASAMSVTLKFAHTYSFENPNVPWDGGVLEYSTNGTPWQDAGPLITQGGYTGVITATAGNPLSGRPAWVYEMPGYPNFSNVTVNLNSLRGSSVRFRFRMGADLNTGAPGWWVDDVFILSIGACPTGTAVATGTPGTCNIQFADVPPSNTFHPFVRCLACRGIVGGYPCGGAGEPCNANNDPYFRPNTNITRGQIAKVVSESAGFSEPAGPQIFEDVPPGSTFYTWVNRLSNRGVIGGYPCNATPTEPCVPPGNRPYFRPNANATRGQLSKVVSEAAGFNEPPGTQLFEDVPSGNTFYQYINRLANRGVIGGYRCGSVGEPCNPPNNRPYFRPNHNVTRGQASKIVASTFFPQCNP